MGQNPATKYTDEFGRETADYVLSSGKPITECCRELGLNPKTVNNWVVKRRRELGGEPDPKADDAEPPVPTTVLCGDITCLETGRGWLHLATVIDLCAHGGRMVALRAHDRRHRGLGAGHGALARLRGGRRDIPFGPRRPVHEQAPGGMGVRQRREAVGGADRQPPRQRGRRVLLRDAQERDWIGYT